MSDREDLYAQIAKDYPELAFQPRGPESIQIRCPNCHDVLISANPNRIFLNFVACLGPDSKMGTMCATCNHELYMDFQEAEDAGQVLPLAYYLTGVVGVDLEVELEYTDAVAKVKEDNDRIIAEYAAAAGGKA